jgi:uncharacterized membrane protein
MNSFIPVLGIVVVILLVLMPFVAIGAFVRVRHLQEDVNSKLKNYGSRFLELERKLARVEEALAALGLSPTRLPKTEPAPIPPPPVRSVIATPAPPRPEPSRDEPPALKIPKPPASIQPPVLSSPLSSSVRRNENEQEDEPAGLEALVGGRWMNYAGILALLIGVAFFLKYAFDNNWVGPRGRVAIGLLAGSALYPWSHRLLEKGYRYFSEGIAGLGAAILYLSLWAGWHYYQIFSQSAAFAMMIVVTAATTIVAIGRNSERIALLALVGGVATPIIVSTGQNQELVLFTYLAILGGGMLALARLRHWKSLPPVSFAATLSFFWDWYGTFYSNDALGVTIFFATVFFFLFAALPVVRSRREGELPILEILIVLVNSFNYVLALRLLLWPDHRWALTISMLFVAAAHLVAERALPSKAGSSVTKARVLFAGLALTFVTLTVPVRLDGRWITIGWAIEGAILIWSGLRIRVAGLRYAGFALFGIALIRLAILPIPAPTFLFNARFATFAICVACLIAACAFARRMGVQVSEQESEWFLAAAIAANVYGLAALSLEIWDLLGRMPSLDIDRGLAQQLALSLLWLVYALSLLVAGIWKKSAIVRWQALILLGVVIGKVFIFDLSFLERFYRIISFIFLGLALLVISFYYQRFWHRSEDQKRA